MREMKKRIITVTAGLLVLAVMLSVTACGTGGRKEEASSKVYEFTDDCGRTVTIPSEPTRIVTSGILSEIIVYALASDLLVASTEKHTEADALYFDETYLNLPHLGSLYGSAELNVEELAVADPQMVIDIGEAKNSLVEDMDSLEAQTGIPSVHIEATLETMPEAYRKLGKLLNREEKAEQLAEFCEKTYSRTMEIMDKVGDKKVRALYVLGTEGLNVIAKGSYHSEIVDLLTDNLAVVENPSGKGTGNEVGMEQISVWNPDFVIFAPGSIYEDLVSEEKETGLFGSNIEMWKNISAIQTGNFVEVPKGPHNWMGTPPSVQRTLALIWLPSVLYPEYCDYDVKTEVTEYYKLFYGIELSDEQYAMLTANAWPN